MGPECLLISSKQDVLRVLLPMLDAMKVKVELCPKPEDGLRKMLRRKFDAVVVDCDQPETSVETIRKVRALSTGKRAIVLAIVEGRAAMRESFHAGASFVLNEPLPAELTVKTMRVAYGLMIGERRRYYRHALEVEVELSFRDKPLRVRSLDLSEGGMAIRGAAGLKVGHTAAVHFKLPGTSIAIDTQAEIMWAKEDGKAGLRFINMPAAALFAMKDFFLKTLSKPVPVAV
jgi:hypothetical protein